jgi:hypothetical protein
VLGPPDRHRADPVLLRSARPAPLDRGGDRQLNHAPHAIAITRARYDPATQEYLERKEAQGKTHKGALRCLKHHLARRFHYLLSLPTARPQPNRGTTDQTAVHSSERDPSDAEASTLASTPTPMICPT